MTKEEINQEILEWRAFYNEESISIWGLNAFRHDYKIAIADLIAYQRALLIRSEKQLVFYNEE